jgi:hypothetical protein
MSIAWPSMAMGGWAYWIYGGAGAFCVIRAGVVEPIKRLTAARSIASAMS